jgi:glycosylphosphatidylinositol deacylase
VQVTGLTVAAVLFALMRQARAWELDLMVPSVVSCIEANLRFPLPLLLLAPGTSVIYYLCSLFGTETPPPLISFLGVSLVCYIFANGVVALLAIVSSIIFQAASFIQVFFKLRLVSKFCVYLSISTTHMIIKLLLQF